MTLTGNVFENPRPMCRTNHLNSPNVDYQNRGVFTAEPEEENWGWGSCYQVQNTQRSFQYYQIYILSFRAH